MVGLGEIVLCLIGCCKIFFFFPLKGEGYYRKILDGLICLRFFKCCLCFCVKNGPN